MAKTDYLLVALFLGAIFVLVYIFTNNLSYWNIINESEGTTNFTASNFSKPEKISVNTSYPLLFQNIRWNHMPLKVYLDRESGRDISWFGEDDLNDFRSATRIWEEKTDRTVSFVETNNREEADIIVEWVRKLNVTRGIKIVGEGGPSVIDTGLFNLTIAGEIYLVPSDVSCRNVNRGLHELGHVLGLDHTDDREDIMYPYESCLLVITEGAIKTIKELYRIEPKPDLYFLNASAIKTGRYLNLEFVVKNQGLLNSTSTSVLFKIDNYSIDSFSILSLSPGEAYILRKTTRSPISFNLIELLVDPENLVDELNEDNNEIILR